MEKRSPRIMQVDAWPASRWSCCAAERLYRSGGRRGDLHSGLRPWRRSWSRFVENTPRLAWAKTFGQNPGPLRSKAVACSRRQSHRQRDQARATGAAVNDVGKLYFNNRLAQAGVYAAAPAGANGPSPNCPADSACRVCTPPVIGVAQRCRWSRAGRYPYQTTESVGLQSHPL